MELTDAYISCEESQRRRSFPDENKTLWELTLWRHGCGLIIVNTEE